MPSLKVLYERKIEEPSLRDGKVLNQSVAVEARRWLDEKGKRDDVVIETISVIDGGMPALQPAYSPGQLMADWQVIEAAIAAFKYASAAHPVIGKTTA